MILLENLKNEKGLVHGITEVEEGSFNFFTNPDFGSRLSEARGIKGKETEVVVSEQIHGARIHVVPPNIKGYIKFGADGLVSSEQGRVLLVKTADCQPVLLFNPEKERVGAVHAGRRGIRRGILKEAVRKMGSPGSLLVGIGPHIKKCCYSFHPETYKEYFKGGFWEPYTEKKGGDFYLDLTKASLEQLTASGVKRKNIEVSEFCTACRPERFFSRRKAEEENLYDEYGRKPATGSFIALKK